MIPLVWFAYRVSLGSVALTGSQRVGWVNSGQRILVVVSFEGGGVRVAWRWRDVRVAGRRRGVRMARRRRGGVRAEWRRRGRCSAGIRRKIGRRRRRGDGQTTVPGCSATVRWWGIRRNGGRVGRRAEIGCGQAKGRVHGAVPGRRTVNTLGPGVRRRWRRRRPGLSDIVGVRAHGESARWDTAARDSLIGAGQRATKYWSLNSLWAAAGTGAQQTNGVSRGAEADVYIVSVIYFRSNEKARFKKRALSWATACSTRYIIIIRLLLWTFTMYDTKRSRQSGRGGSLVASGRLSAASVFVFGVIIKKILF